MHCDHFFPFLDVQIAQSFLASKRISLCYTMSKNKKMSIILLLSLIGVIFAISSELLATQTEGRTEEVLDTANKNLKISMQAPDD